MSDEPPLGRARRALRVELRDRVRHVLRRIFWILPAPLRGALNAPRHWLARALRRRSAGGPHHGAELSFAEFSALHLGVAAGARPVVIFELNLDWCMPQPQRPHHLARALGRAGCLVIYRTFAHEATGWREVEENVWLCGDEEVARIPGAVRCFFSTSLVARARDLAAAGDYGRVVYDYIDRIDAAISGGAAAARRLHGLRQAAFAGGADVIVASARVLYDEALAACGEARCAYVANGVDVAHYRARGDQRVLPALRDLRRQGRPIVGYFGAIAPWLWFEAMDGLAARMPDTVFVYVGPDYGGCVPRLPRRGNVLYVGALNYDELPAHAGLFDVCMIPFRLGDIAKATSPLKLYEYFALEKPVVVTADLTECLGYRGVFVGQDVETLESAIRRALEASRDETLREALRQQADSNSWDARAAAWMERVMQPGDDT